MRNDECSQQLADGVIGYTMEHDGAIYIPLIVATNSGNGDVGRYLDSLPRNQTIRVPNVMNPRLAGMLERRGFVVVEEFAEEFGESVDVHERKAL